MGNGLRLKIGRSNIEADSEAGEKRRHVVHNHLDHSHPLPFALANRLETTQLVSGAELITRPFIGVTI